MTDKPVGVAVVGVGPDHWSTTAHLPAIRALPGLALRHLVASTSDGAAAAAARWDVPATHRVGDALADDGVDLVAVTIRVPKHAELVRAAVAAGKHVYCEWPLAVDTAEAADLAATTGDLVCVAGLQGRYSPELGAMADTVAKGGIGRPLAANLRLFLSQGLQARPAHRAHLRHRSVGANVLTIQAGHALDMLTTVLGRPTVEHARLWSSVPEFRLDTGERLPRDAPDSLIAVLDHEASGGVATVAHLTQTAAEESFALEILGTDGILRLTGPGQPQFGGLTLHGGPSPDSTPSALPHGHPGENLARAYAAVADAIRTGRRHPLLPDFQVAADLHRLLDDIRGTHDSRS